MANEEKGSRTGVVRTRAGVAGVGVVIAILVTGARSLLSSPPPPPPPPPPPLPPAPASDAPFPPVTQERSAPAVFGAREAAQELARDDYMHQAFVAVGQGDLTIWKDAKGNVRNQADSILCRECLVRDFVVANHEVAWVSVLDLEVAGFDSAVRVVPMVGWTPRDGSGFEAGERVVSLTSGGDIATDGVTVYAVEGNDDAGGLWQTIVRVDLAKRTKSVLAKTEGGVRAFVHAAGQLFVLWSTSPVWRLQAVATANGSIRDVATLEVPLLPELVASPMELYLLERDGWERTERGHFTTLPLAGGTPTPLYDTAPDEIIGHMAADASGLYVIRWTGYWSLARLTKGASPQELARFDEVPHALALRKADVAVALATRLVLVPK